MKQVPTALVILDGFGYRSERKDNAIARADTPYLDWATAEYPSTLLHASGPFVGLPEGYMGNSEVGHLTIGAGRIVPQPITELNDMARSGTLDKLPALRTAFEKISQSGGRLHLMGLLSDAGVHSHTAYLYALIKSATELGIAEIILHPFLDGRDTPPRSAEKYLTELEEILSQIPQAKIGSLHGRFYAMDRDKNWERTHASHQVLTGQTTVDSRPWQEILQASYTAGDTDEFLKPTLLSADTALQEGDAILFFNTRPDRARQLTRCFMDPKSVPLELKSAPLSAFITPTSYDHIPGITVLLEQTPLHNTLKEVISAAGKSIFTIAETEKYAHLTYFFAGGREEPFPSETQIMIPSIPQRDYADHPQMSAPKITERVLTSLQEDMQDFYLINYANADMVAHSGDLKATIKAIECLDAQLKALHEQIVTKQGGTLYITADHGNAEDMFDEMHDQPRTAHTSNPVPFIAINSREQLEIDQLADIAPFILRGMVLPVPEEMK